MMAKYITIDCGTTNTRIALLEENTVKDIIKLPIGAGNTAQNGSNAELKREIAKVIAQFQGKDSEKRITAIYASGMITSELGLYNLAHIEAPAGKKELRAGAKTIKIEDVSDIPITFIPGVKNSFDVDIIESFRDADVMRGEETEVLGLMNILNISAPFTAVLPGTHTKIIKIDNQGKINSCFTAMSGELFAAIKKDTILKSCFCEDAVNIEKYSKYLEKGYELSEEIGFNAAIFKSRLLKNFYNISEKECTVYITGAVLYSDIKLLKKVAGNDVILIGGGEPLRSTFLNLIRKYMKNEVIAANDEQVKLSTVIGTMSIFE